MSAKHQGLWITARGSNFRFRDSSSGAGMAMGTEGAGAWGWVSSTVSCCNCPAKMTRTYLLISAAGLASAVEAAINYYEGMDCVLGPLLARLY